MNANFLKKILLNSYRAKKSAVEFENNHELKKLYWIFESSPESGWILGKTEALTLFKLIKKYRPKNALDLGLGIGASSAIMAYASDEDALVTSVEQFPKCIALAKKLIPQNLQRKIGFVFSEPYAFKNDLISRYSYFSGYKNLPVERGFFDFLLIDGPGAWLENGQFIKLPNGDLINLLPHLAPGCKILVDGRRSAVELYKRFLTNYLNVIEKDKSYTLMERSSKKLDGIGSIEIKDVSLEARAKENYF